jgi:hypothetical protein
MITRNRAILLSLAAAVALTVSASASLAQEAGGPSCSPDGAWFATATAGGRTLPFMDAMSNPTTPGHAGTVMCTLSGSSFDTPFGRLNATLIGHGN